MDAELKTLLARINGTVPYLDTELTDVNQRGIFNDTPLSVVITWGDAEAVQMLLDAGADPNATIDFMHMPILHHAVTMGDARIVALLLEAGAKPDTLEGDYSPYAIAKLLKHDDVAELLLKWMGRTIPHPPSG